MSNAQRPSLQLGTHVVPSIAELDTSFALARQVDEGSLDFLTIEYHPYLGHYVDTWTLLVTLAAQTRRVRLLPNVLNLPLRPPAMIAKSAATLDLLSKGRFEMGLGAGALWDHITTMHNQRRSKDEAVRATEEAIHVMRTLWEPPAPDAKVSFKGQFYHLENAQPGPVPTHKINIWLGSYGPRMLRLTGRLTDGWLPTNMYLAPDALPAANEIIDNAAIKAGREPSSVRRGYNVAGAIIVPGGPALTTNRANAILGPASLWIDTLAHYYHDLHMDTLIFWPVAGDRIEQVRLFSEQVLPALKETTR
jgi:alkanesulfonate monooxygenase SsuD/methylene tetrahydromethanopterin reductase-like flavin-dependent oxidoreductase (luciferase family)